MANSTELDTRWESLCSETSEIANIMISHKSQKRKMVEGSCFRYGNWI